MKIDKNYFPGWVRKSITFTNDDGNIPMDTKFINILKPYGIKGTFNLCGTSYDLKDSDFYRNMYRGYGIQNHLFYHPFAIEEEYRDKISDEIFDDLTADKEKVYKTDIKGIYRFHGHAWRSGAFTEDYCRLIKETHEKLEKIFGEGSVRAFVWPFCEQKDPAIIEFIKDFGYRAIRKTGSLKDSTGYSMPADRMRWTYNIANKELIEQATIYRNYPDDGELKFFCFGLHSVDYENGGDWETLREFAKSFGNRPEEFYYASVDDIFDYEDAVNSLIVKDDGVYNPSEITLYVKIDGERVTLEPHSEYKL